MRIKPFVARRPQSGFEQQIAALPYDILSREEAIRLAAGNAESMLYVTRPDIAFAAEHPSTSGDVYAAARSHYRSLLDRGHLIADHQARFYIYEQELGGLRQRGIVALFHVDDYRRDIVRRHENTRRDKESDRTRLLQVVGAQPGLVFLACRENAAMNKLLKDPPADGWIYDFKAADGTYHRVAALTDHASVERALKSVPVAYIADGHHRAAAAAGVAAMTECVDEATAWFPAVLFPADTLHVFAYHRCVRSLGEYDRAGFLDTVSERFTIRDADPATPVESGTIRLQMIDGCRDLSLKQKLDTELIADQLDVAVLQNHLLAPLLGIDDPRENPNLVFIGGTQAVHEIGLRLQSGEIAAAFLMAPVEIEQMMQVADAGMSMPPKSTWFEPKLLEGLLIHDREAP